MFISFFIQYLGTDRGISRSRHEQFLFTACLIRRIRAADAAQDLPGVVPDW
jgi:hypothetical protein